MNTCENCIYYHNPPAVIMGDRGYCRINPPVESDTWPGVAHGDWCGKHTARGIEPAPPTLDEMALNEAAWEFVDAYSPITGEPMSTKLQNCCKVILRRAIATYLEKARKP